jgi:hypothetical protein
MDYNLNVNENIYVLLIVEYSQNQGCGLLLRLAVRLLLRLWFIFWPQCGV